MSDDTMNMSVDLDELLDGDFEDLPDLAGFDAWPAGTYHATCSMEIKSVNDKPCVEVSYKMIEAKELAKPEESTAPAIGAVNSELCMLDNQLGLANLKKHLKVFGAYFGIKNRREIIDVVKDVEVLVVNKPRWDKKAEVWRFRVDEQAVI